MTGLPGKRQADARGAAWEYGGLNLAGDSARRMGLVEFRRRKQLAIPQIRPGVSARDQPGHVEINRTPALSIRAAVSTPDA